jgi:diguanylate cyclase (GGDEF)-like protein
MGPPQVSDTSGLTTRLVLAYARTAGGRPAVDAILAACGLAAREDELLDEHGWFPYDVKIRLFEAAAEVLDDPEVMFRVGASALELNAGDSVKIALKALGSPALVYRNVVRANGKFTRSHEMQLVKSGGHHVTLRFVDLAGRRYHPLDCQYNRGLLTCIPELFGQRPAEVRHSRCAADGAEHCTYEVSWDESGNHARFGIAMGALSATALGLSIALNPELEPAAVAGGLAACALAAARVRGVWQRRLAQLRTELRDQALTSARLSRSLEDLVSELRLEDVLAKVTANARAAVGGHEYALLLAGDEGLRCQSSSELPAATLATLERWARATPALLHEPRLVDDCAAVALLVDLAADPLQPLRSLCSAPLVVRGDAVGLLVSLAVRPRVFLPRDVEQLRSYATQAGIAVLNARLYADQRELAIRDGLTGLLNRAAFNDALARALQAPGAGPAVVLVDLDGFKAINDRAGHAAGDALLREVADALRRDAGEVFRLGGDEFAVLLIGADAASAPAVAERIEAAVTALEAPIGASTGIARHPADGAGAGELLARADARLYATKRTHHGRRRDRRGGPVDGVIALAAALDLRDPSTAAHSRTVASYVQLTAAALGLAAARVERLRLAGLLHDLGKIAVPDAVLHKDGPLTPDEWELMRGHPALGARMCVSAGLEDVAPWVRAHHERPDGAGYPDGLRSDEIPLEAAVLAVADAYEAMTADRPYRAGIGPDAARAELRRCAGTQFEPHVVDAFLAATALGAPAPPAARRRRPAPARS